MNIWIFIAAFVVVDIIFAVVIIRFVVKGQWGELVKRYPPVPAAEDAVTQRRQSFRLGLLNLGWCVRTSVDETHLHLALPRFFEWFGATPVSIPWSRIELVGGSRSGTWRTARVDRQTLHGPAWCLDLADPTSEDDLNDGETHPAHPV